MIHADGIIAAKDVGIIAFEIYYPPQYVDQTQLEQYDNVSKGKYTIGLGQSKMGFCLDYEDINSICLTVLHNLFDKYQISPNDIGRLDVGTETIIDKSKSVKSTLMSLFESFDVEGVDNVNACFGGTAALFNAINWIESSAWDGRYAAVVMGDIAVYAKGNARPTGGCGAIALVIGPNAPLKFEQGLRSLHISHAYDFYKPVLDSEYPIVDGKLSIKCYLSSLDKCYDLYKKKYKKKSLNDNNNNDKTSSRCQIESEIDEFDLTKANGFVFHSPYCKLVQKSFSRLLWNDYNDNAAYLQADNGDHIASASGLKKFKNLSLDDIYTDKELEVELLKLSKDQYQAKTHPSLLFSKLVGNMYTPSLYSCLASYLISKSKDELLMDSRRIVLFSYGSGFAAAMFSLIVNDACSNQQFQLDKILANLNASKQALETNRVEIDPQLFDKYLHHRETYNKTGKLELSKLVTRLPTGLSTCCTLQVPRVPTLPQDAIYPGTWYLTSVDEHYRRTYARKSTSTVFDLNHASVSLNAFLKQIVH